MSFIAEVIKFEIFREIGAFILGISVLFIAVVVCLIFGAIVEAINRRKDRR